MKKRTHKLLSIISIVCILLFGVSVVTYAATSVAQSTIKTSTLLGYSYDYWATVASYDDPEAIAATMVLCDGTTAPTGYMGAIARLYNSVGVMCKSTSWTYNSSAAAGVSVQTPYNSYPYRGTYFAKGQIKLYNGNGYNTYDTNQTPYVSNNTTLASQSTTNIINYQINENGETYGSGLYSDVLGKEPDLISAYGIDGTFGYVRAKDFDSNANTPEKAIEQQNMNKGSRKIPLYEKDGKTVIGVFEIVQAEVKLLDKKVK